MRASHWKRAAPVPLAIRAGWGMTLLVAPGALLRLFGGADEGRAPRRIMRVLGFRQLIQAGAEYRLGENAPEDRYRRRSLSRSDVGHIRSGGPALATCRPGRCSCRRRLRRPRCDQRLGLRVPPPGKSVGSGQHCMGQNEDHHDHSHHQVAHVIVDRAALDPAQDPDGA